MRDRWWRLGGKLDRGSDHPLSHGARPACRREPPSISRRRTLWAKIVGVTVTAPDVLDRHLCSSPDTTTTMNRLAPLQHALRAARPSAARPSSSARPLACGARVTALPRGRRYASNTAKPTSAASAPSKKTVLTPPSPEFERILASLRPGLEREDIAKRVAALFLLTEKKNEIEAVEKKLQSLLQGQHFEEVSERIKHYLKNPPKDLQELAKIGMSSEFVPGGCMLTVSRLYTPGTSMDKQ